MCRPMSPNRAQTSRHQGLLNTQPRLSRGQPGPHSRRLEKQADSTPRHGWSPYTQAQDTGTPESTFDDLRISHVSWDHPHTPGASLSPPELPLTLLADFRTRPEPEGKQTMGGDRAARPAVGVASLEDRGQFPVLR